MTRIGQTSMIYLDSEGNQEAGTDKDSGSWILGWGRGVTRVSLKNICRSEAIKVR
jgi:hypothetical protein